MVERSYLSFQWLYVYFTATTHVIGEEKPEGAARRVVILVLPDTCSVYDVNVHVMQSEVEERSGLSVGSSHCWLALV